MARPSAGIALVALAMTLAAGTVSGRSADSTGGKTWRAAPLIAIDPALQASLARIAARSALWRQDLDRVRTTGRYALIVTPKQLETLQGMRAGTSGFDATVFAEVVPVLHRGAIAATVVVVNVRLLEQIHSREASLPGEFNADLDRILVHEIYGHAMPYLTAGDLSGRCADPGPNERPSEACAIQRENAVREELRLGKRSDAGFASLALTRRFF